MFAGVIVKECLYVMGYMVICGICDRTPDVLTEGVDCLVDVFGVWIVSLSKGVD